MQSDASLCPRKACDPSSTADVRVPNCIHVNADSTKLYITDSPCGPTYGAALGSLDGSASQTTCEFDLDADGYPRNRRVFELAAWGLANGIHVDDQGRVWTDEADGVVGSGR